MKLKATKVLTNALNEELKNQKQNEDFITSISSFQLCKFTEHEYKVYVDIDTYKHTEYDYNYNTGYFNAIEVVYLDSCYAMRQYISTNDLSSNAALLIDSSLLILVSKSLLRL